jgi:hypothetical protein
VSGALTIAELQQWTGAGATWQVVSLGDERAVVDLWTCTGTPVERREASDPAVISYVRASRDNLDDGPR